MRMNYISKIQTNLKKYNAINTKKITSRVLDGSYKSVYKGRSMNFDELREYVEGDDIKDMDWKASSRSRKLLVRQYIAEKKHNIMLVMDTNLDMLAYANETQEKKDVALLSAGTLAYLVNRNGDYVSAIFPTEKSLSYFPFKTGLMNIENILSSYDKAVTVNNKSNIGTALEYVIKNVRRSMIMLIVTDLKGIIGIPEATLRRLMLMSDVLLINVEDTDICGRNVYDVRNGEYMPEFFTMDKKLAILERETKKSLVEACENKLKKYGVTYATISDTNEIDEKIIELFGKHKYR